MTSTCRKEIIKYLWSYEVSKVGQVCIANHGYSVGKTLAGRRVDIRFDPHDRRFVFCEGESGQPIRRCPAKGLDVTTVTPASTHR